MKFGGFGSSRLQKWGVFLIRKVSKLWGGCKKHDISYTVRKQEQPKTAFFSLLRIKFTCNPLIIIATRSRKSGIEWIEMKSRISAGIVVKCNHKYMSAMHFIFGRSFSWTKWCYVSQGNWTLLRNLHCHRITLVELFVFNSSPSPILSWHVSFI